MSSITSSYSSKLAALASAAVDKLGSGASASALPSGPNDLTKFREEVCYAVTAMCCRVL